MAGDPQPPAGARPDPAAGPPHHLDHNASTPIDSRVLERFLEVERSCPGNPGSLHSSGRRSRAVLEDARQEVASALGVAAGEILFVSGGTEANNLAVCGSGDPRLPVLLGDVEHPSVLEAARSRGIVRWSVDPEGRVLVTPPEQPVGLLALVHGQNEVGTLQPIAQAGALARELGVPLHVDAAQTLGRVSLAEAVAASATLSLSCHKVGGPKGVGILVVRTDLRPLMAGGGQESGLRPGTQSPALAAAAARSVSLAVTEQNRRASIMQRARAAFLSVLAASTVKLHVLTPLADSLPNTVTLYFDGVEGRNLLPALDLAGVEASQGSACSSGSPTPPRILRAMGLSDGEAKRCVRFSFSYAHDERDAVRAAEITTRVLAQLIEKTSGRQASH